MSAAADPATYAAFAGPRLLANGPFAAVVLAARAALAADEAHVLIFEDATGRQVDVDTAPPEPAAGDEPPVANAGRGRPKLGVTAREVTLLPRHWEWLATQPGGASAALRRLVEDARRSTVGADRARQAQQAAYGAMSVLAGDLPGYEEAARALFARRDADLDRLIAPWPTDIRTYLQRLAQRERAART